ncbi:MAG: fatty acid-binding protein DegV [delta proteobacterium ML8_F1]|nr:MAG: fatty acid-binding protein DegV [delta proteobacterium ML8_F1]
MIRIITDSTCDLSDEVLEKHRITMVPLYVTLGETTYRDRVDIQPDDFYKVIEKEDTIKTANPSPEDFLKAFEEAVKEGADEIVCINMSSGTSGSYQAAVLGRELFFERNFESAVKIRVIDSISMSHGTGWLVLKGARLLEEGAGYEDIIDFLEMYKGHMKHYLSVDDLDHLIRSGRLTNASAFIGKMLKLKPIMTMKNTKGAIVAKERGRKKVLGHYIREFKARADLDITDFVIIGYTSDRMVAENLKQKLEAETDFTGEIMIMQMGVSVGAHVGLGGIACYFVEKGHQPDGILINEYKQFLEAKEEMKKRLKSFKKS